MVLLNWSAWCHILALVYDMGAYTFGSVHYRVALHMSGTWACVWCRVVACVYDMGIYAGRGENRAGYKGWWRGSCLVLTQRPPVRNHGSLMPWRRLAAGTPPSLSGDASPQTYSPFPKTLISSSRRLAALPALLEPSIRSCDRSGRAWRSWSCSGRSSSGRRQSWTSGGRGVCPPNPSPAL